MTNEQASYNLIMIRVSFIENATKEQEEIIDRTFEKALKALEQQFTLDKITAEIQGLRNCSCSCSDGIIDDVEDIIDKYKAESEVQK